MESTDLTVGEGEIPVLLDEWTFVVLPLLLDVVELMIYNLFNIEYSEFISNVFYIYNLFQNIYVL